MNTNFKNKKSIYKRLLIVHCSLLIFFFLTSGYSGGYGEEEKKLAPADSKQGEEGFLLKGREIFHERCAACHGIDGNAILPDAPSFAKGERLEKTDKELLESIRHGKGDIMPPWEGVISDKEQRDILGYVKVVVGDKVFGEKCVKCHQKIPNIPPEIPDDKSLKDSNGSIRICKGCDMEKSMTREEQIEVIRFIRYLGTLK